MDGWEQRRWEVREEGEADLVVERAVDTERTSEEGESQPGKNSRGVRGEYEPILFCTEDVSEMGSHGGERREREKELRLWLLEASLGEPTKGGSRMR